MGSATSFLKDSVRTTDQHGAHPFGGALRSVHERNEMKSRVAIGYTIYARRHDLGMTGLELARASGVSNAYISEVEHGKKEVSSDYLALLAKGLGLTVGDILISAGHLTNEWEGYLTTVRSKRTVEV